MKDIQVLVATMHQEDFSLGNKMNIPCDAVFANQADREAIETLEENGHTWKMITTTTRGVGLNRNIALNASDGEIIVFSDEDVVYYDGTFQRILDAFSQRPDADVIIFAIDLTKNGEVIEHKGVPNKKMRLAGSLRYGACAIAAKRTSILKKGITFNQFFGGGCIYGSGEDSLFIKECFDKKLKVYSYDYTLGTCSSDTSTWFQGYNEKFFFDKGALYGYLFPRLKFPAILYFSMRFRQSDISLVKRVKLMLAGAKAGKNLIPYQA